MYTVKLNLGRCLPVWTSSLSYTFQRLIYSSATRTEANHTGIDPDTFGQLAAQSGSRGSLGKEKSTKTKRHKQFPKPENSQLGHFDTKRDVLPLSQAGNFDVKRDAGAKAGLEKATLEKWRQFRDTKYNETLKFLQGFQDDSEEDYNHQIRKSENRKYHNTTDVTGEMSELRAASQVPATEHDSTSGIQIPIFPDNFESKSRAQNPEFTDNSGVNSGTQSPKHPDSFGTIIRKVAYKAEEGDEGDRREERFEEARIARKHRPQWYGQRMKNLCRERRLAEALHILEVEMPSVRARPNEFCYNVLINACGRAGYTKKAFQLYNQMKQRNLEARDLVYTGLFTACAHSPWPTTDGLNRATRLREQLIEKAYPVNQITSHAMIKAFGRCGDIKTAFQIVDEMVANGLVVTTETMNFLLQACISDTTTGFRHAIMVWRKMRELNLKPDIYSYNLLIRCTAECQAGDPTLTSQLLNPQQQHTSHCKNPGSSKKTITEKVLLLDIDDKAGNVNDTQTATEVNNDSFSSFSQSTRDKSTSKNYVSPQNIQDSFSSQSTRHQRNMDLSSPTRPQEREFTEVEVQREVMEVANSGLPDILGHEVTAGVVVALEALDKPQDRLALLGGVKGLMKQMMKDKVNPDLKTVTQLLTSLPSDTPAEEALLQSMRTIGLQPDTQFCNMVIRKRTMRGDLQAAKAVLDVMQDHHLLPDLVTFGCLALGCHNLHDATQLLNDMDMANFRPNLEIMSALTKNGLVVGNFHYALEMLCEMRRRDLTPNTQLLESLERGRVRAKNLLLKQEGGEKMSKWKVDGARLFLLEYKKWLKTSDVQLPDHPWAQYRMEEGCSVAGEA